MAGEGRAPLQCLQLHHAARGARLPHRARYLAGSRAIRDPQAHCLQDRPGGARRRTALAPHQGGNAVNLTDGLDGLAIMPTVMVGSALGIFAYVAGHAVFSKYLGLPYIPGAGELGVICGALAGAGLGFLWFNAYPAEVFMGDVGALALGAALGTIAVIVRQEIVLFIMGGVFVAV